eukprot:m.333775 g.333775  ORF g.333775 m.333775 type:complete len:394 (-) comp17220_c0_seq1:104-1285(-)
MAATKMLLCVLLALASYATAVPVQPWTENAKLKYTTMNRMSAGGEVAKRYTLNLDDAPEDRWTNIVKDFKQYSKGIIAYFEEFIPKSILPVVEDIAADLESYFPEDYAGEMRGIAKGYGLKLGDVVIVNLIYQLEGIGRNCSAGNNTGPCPSGIKNGPGLCTSIIAKDENGKIFHGRNLDWSIPAVLRKLMVDIDYVKDGKVIFTGSQPAGFVGILHGVRHNGWSYSMDARDEGGNLAANIIQALLRHSMTPTQHVRRSMEQAATYKEAIEVLSKTPMINPAYLIVGGLDTGCVITRGRDKVVDVWNLDEVMAKNSSAFYLLETNYDHWGPVPTYDNRRDPGNAMMEKLGRSGVTHDGIFKVMTSWPLFNHHTDYTNVMSADNSSMYGTLVWN